MQSQGNQKDGGQKKKVKWEVFRLEQSQDKFPEIIGEKKVTEVLFRT